MVEVRSREKCHDCGNLGVLILWSSNKLNQEIQRTHPVESTGPTDSFRWIRRSHGSCPLIQLIPRITWDALTRQYPLGNSEKTSVTSSTRTSLSGQVSRNFFFEYVFGPMFPFGRIGPLVRLEATEAEVNVDGCILICYAWSLMETKVFLIFPHIVACLLQGYSTY